MIGELAGYVELLARALPGQPALYYEDEIPLVMGTQLICAYLAGQEGVRLVPPGLSAANKAREILGDALESWLDGR